MGEQKNISVLVGPNGNLTTLVAAIAALHPKVHGFNHGFEVFNAMHLPEKDYKYYRQPHPMVTDADFMIDYSEEKVMNFFNNAIRISQLDGPDVKRPKTGKDNRYDVLTSHAFNRNDMIRAYNKMYPKGKPEATPENIQTVFWKEGMFLTKTVRRLNPKLEGVIEDPRVVLYYPIRNPIHTYYSCKYKGFFPIMKDSVDGDPLSFVLYSLKWAYDLSKDLESKGIYNKFWFTFEQEMTSINAFDDFEENALLIENHDENWAQMAKNATKIEAVRSYASEPDLKEITKKYREFVYNNFDYAFRNMLLEFGK